MRRQLSSTVPSIGVPSAAFRRYFISQIFRDWGSECGHGNPLIVGFGWCIYVAETQDMPHLRSTRINPCVNLNSATIGLLLHVQADGGIVAEFINILKLCVGAESVEDLIDWHDMPSRPAGPRAPRVHVTRMWPKREAEVTGGGSLYWVIKGVVLARQRILRLEEVIGADGIRRCALVLDAEVIRTEPAPRRPFQGWRYLDPPKCPRDLPKGRAKEDTLPPELARALADIGLR